MALRVDGIVLLPPPSVAVKFMLVLRGSTFGSDIHFGSATRTLRRLRRSRFHGFSLGSVHGSRSSWLAARICHLTSHIAHLHRAQLVFHHLSGRWFYSLFSSLATAPRARELANPTKRAQQGTAIRAIERIVRSVCTLQEPGRESVPRRIVPKAVVVDDGR